jgi:hypothetical protein
MTATKDQLAFLKAQPAQLHPRLHLETRQLFKTAAKNKLSYIKQQPAQLHPRLHLKTRQLFKGIVSLETCIN